MRAGLKAAATLCLLAVLLGVVPQALPTGPVAQAGALEDAEERRRQIEELIKQKQADFERLSSQERSVVKDINRLERELDGLARELRDLQAQLDQAEGAIAATEVEIADAQARLEVRNALMLKRIRALSEVGYVNYLEVLLGSRSFGDFLARFEMLRQVLSSDVTLFREVREEKRQLEEKKAYLEEQRAELAVLKDKTTASKASVEQKQDDREARLAQLREDKAAIAEALDELERTSNELADYILQLQLAAQRAGGIPTFVWPTGGPITSRFGPRFHPILRVYKNHTGLDIAAPSGQAVLAAAPGIVILAGVAGGYGKCVIIDHGGFYSTLYAHLSAILVAPGQEVGQGLVIGRVGSTGYSTGPHLHFEVRFRGEPRDPLSLLPKR